MAIDFPNSPSNGTTYTYLGVNYTYVDSGGGLGYWKVDTVGTISPASQAEVDAGTDNNKYITPYGMESSKYASLPQVNYHSKVGKVQLTTGQRYYRDLLRLENILVDGGGWADIGPTGSGGNEWNALNLVPAGSILCVNAFNTVRSNAVGYSDVYAQFAKGGVTPYTDLDTLQTSIDSTDTTYSTSSYSMLWIPLDDNKVFQAQYTSSNALFGGIRLRYMGFIEP